MRTRAFDPPAVLAVAAVALAAAALFAPPSAPMHTAGNAAKYTGVDEFLKGTKTLSTGGKTTKPVVVTAGAVKTLQGFKMDNAHIAKALATYDKADLVRAVKWYKELMDGTNVSEAMLTSSPYQRYCANRYKNKNGWQSCAAVIDRSPKNLGTCGDVLEFKYRSFYNKFLRSPSGAPLKVDIQAIHSVGLIADHATAVLVPAGEKLEDYFNSDGSWKKDGRGLLVLDSRAPHLVSLDTWRGDYFHSWSDVNFSDFLRPDGRHWDPSAIAKGQPARNTTPNKTISVTRKGLGKSLTPLPDPGVHWGGTSTDLAPGGAKRGVYQTYDSITPKTFPKKQGAKKK